MESNSNKLSECRINGQHYRVMKFDRNNTHKLMSDPRSGTMLTGHVNSGKYFREAKEWYKRWLTVNSNMPLPEDSITRLLGNETNAVNKLFEGEVSSVFISETVCIVKVVSDKIEDRFCKDGIWECGHRYKGKAVLMRTVDGTKVTPKTKEDLMVKFMEVA